MSVRSSSPQSPSIRRGAGAIQALAILSSFAVGMWLGTHYLGVPMRDIAHTALSESELLEKLPENWRIVSADCLDGECPETITPEQKAAQLKGELTALQAEIASLAAGSTSETAAAEPAPESVAVVQREGTREATVGYWQQLGEIAAQVTKLHNSIGNDSSETTVWRVLDVRRRAYDYGQKAVDAIATTSVDQQAVEGGRRMAALYRHGAEYYEEVLTAWDGKTTMAEDQLFQAQRHHVKQADFVRQKVGELQLILSRRYSTELRPLAI